MLILRGTYLENPWETVHALRQCNFMIFYSIFVFSDAFSDVSSLPRNFFPIVQVHSYEFYEGFLDSRLCPHFGSTGRASVFCVMSFYIHVLDKQHLIYWISALCCTTLRADTSLSFDQHQIQPQCLHVPFGSFVSLNIRWDGHLYLVCMAGHQSELYVLICVPCDKANASEVRELFSNASFK